MSEQWAGGAGMSEERFRLIITIGVFIACGLVALLGLRP